MSSYAHPRLELCPPHLAGFQLIKGVGLPLAQVPTNEGSLAMHSEPRLSQCPASGY